MPGLKNCKSLYELTKPWHALAGAVLRFTLATGVEPLPRDRLGLDT